MYDIILIAGVIKRHMNRECNSGVCLDTDVVLLDLTQDLAVVFASDNPQFDQDKFLTACDIE